MPVKNGEFFREYFNLDPIGIANIKKGEFFHDFIEGREQMHKPLPEIDENTENSILKFNNKLHHQLSARTHETMYQKLLSQSPRFKKQGSEMLDRSRAIELSEIQN